MIDIDQDWVITTPINPIFKANIGMRLIKITALLAVLVAGVVATDAHAGPYTYSSYGFSGSNVHFSDAGLGINNEYGGAGAITLNGPFTITAYCVDLADWLLGSGTYNLAGNPAANPNLAGVSSITGDSKIADITNLVYNGTNSAAVQLAIWETEYGSAASFNPDDSTLQAQASTYLTDAETVWHSPSNIDLFELNAANGQTNQTLVYLADPVPEPATLALLGAAIFLIGIFRHRHSWGLPWAGAVTSR